MKLTYSQKTSAYIVFVFLSSLIYLGWGTLTPTYFVEGGARDGLLIRSWGVIVPFISLLYYWLKGGKADARAMCELTFFGYLINYAYILHINNYHQTYILGSFIIQTGANSIIDRERPLVIYNIFNLLLAPLILIVPAPLVNPYFYLTAVGTIAFLMCVMNIIKINVQRKMLTLEEQLSVEENKRIIVEGLAHEINNPLMILQTLRNRLLRIQRRSDPDEMRQIFETIISEKSDSLARAITRIDSVISDLHRTACGNLIISKEDVDVSEVLLEILAQYDKQERLKFNLDIASQLILSYDKKSLQKILRELLQNANDFARSKVNIIIHPNRITITNDGPAIPKHLEHKIFEPFFTTKDIGHGKGLGLAISKGLSIQHSSTITLGQNLDGQVSFELNFA